MKQPHFLASREVAQSFSKAASRYASHARVQSELADWLAEWLPPERAGRALEVGAGTGLFTRHLAHWPQGVTATDLSSAMGAVGHQSAPWADWRVMAAEHPLPGPWDWIFSSAMLQWAEHPAVVFRAWRERLSVQPLGRILGALFVAGSLPEWLAVAGDDAPLLWRPPEFWRAALINAGLRVIRDETSERVFTYPSAHDFLRSLHGGGAAPQRRLGPGALRQRLREYEAQFSTEQGVQATWMFYRFEAERALTVR